MKTIITFFTICFYAIQLSGQDCPKLRSENEYLKKQVSELKEILLINTPLKEIQAGDINVKLISVTGDSRSQTVQIEMLFTNMGINANRFTTKIKSLINAGGSEVLLENAQIGAKSGNYYIYSELYRNTPLTCIYTFKGVVPETSIIKAFPVPFQYKKQGTRTTTKEEVVFNDLTINWK